MYRECLIMLSTRKLLTDVREVPDTWIFEYFARLDTRLDGTEVKIRSLFNANDRNPSMYIFWSQRLSKYWFHDFSTGKTGDAIKFVQELFNCSFTVACNIILTKYFTFTGNDLYTTIPRSTSNTKFRVSAYEVRKWNTDDANYWTSFHIGSRLLETYGVRALKGYVMQNEAGERFEVAGGYLYGYFSKAGMLYKIYRPKRINSKFIKVGNYLQGIEQLTNRRCLVLVSSLKDGLSLCSLQLDLDFVATDSENSLLDPTMVKELNTRYQMRMFTLLDNDEAGIKAMKEYRKRYNLSPILLSLEKDISDSVKKHGPLYVRDRLVPMIDRKLNECL